MANGAYRRRRHLVPQAIEARPSNLKAGERVSTLADSDFQPVAVETITIKFSLPYDKIQIQSVETGIGGKGTVELAVSETGLQFRMVAPPGIPQATRQRSIALFTRPALLPRRSVQSVSVGQRTSGSR